MSEEDKDIFSFGVCKQCKENKTLKNGFCKECNDNPDVLDRLKDMFGM